MNLLRHFGRTPWAGDRPIARPLATQDSITHTKKKRENISMHRAGLEVTVPVLNN